MRDPYTEDKALYTLGVFFDALRDGKSIYEAEELYKEAEKNFGPICDFCYKTNKQVKILVSSDTAFICNECVILAAEIVFSKLSS